MVYNDYELVSTKRVGNKRRMGFILLRRQYTAMGGNPTVFTAGLFGVAGTMLKLTGSAVTTSQQQPLLSSGGARFLGRSGLIKAAPTLLGLGIGITTFGDKTELSNLLWNCGTYSREMKAIKDEHYFAE